MRRLLLIVPFASLVNPGHSTHAQYYPYAPPGYYAPGYYPPPNYYRPPPPPQVLFSAALPGALLLRGTAVLQLRGAACIQLSELRHPGSIQAVQPVKSWNLRCWPATAFAPHAAWR